MDRRDLEPSARLHEDQSWLQALLRRDVRGTVSRRQGASLRAGVRLAPGSSGARLAIPLALAEARVCELNERSLPRWRAGRLYRSGLQSHGQGELAYVPSAHEKIRETEGTAQRTSAPRCRAAAHLVGSERRGSEVWLASNQPSPEPPPEIPLLIHQPPATT